MPQYKLYMKKYTIPIIPMMRSIIAMIREILAYSPISATAITTNIKNK